MAWSSPYRRMPTDQPGHRRSRMPKHNHAVDLSLAGVVAAQYHPSHRPRPAASLQGREVTGMTATDRSR
jgi:hypothetical protein